MTDGNKLADEGAGEATKMEQEEPRNWETDPARHTDKYYITVKTEWMDTHTHK